MIYRLIRLYGIFSVTLLVFISVHSYYSDVKENYYYEKFELTNELLKAQEHLRNDEGSSGEGFNVTVSKDVSPSRNDKKKKGAIGDGPPIYILWTRWRSGSSFLGQLLAYAKTNTFYSYEPLHAFGLHVMREDDKMTKVALWVLKEIMKCHYDRHQDLVDYFVKTEFYYFYNPLTKNKCRPIAACNGTKILTELCRGATTHIVKLLRLSLKYGEKILKENPRIKIVYLARDPRATLQSRSRLLWCTLEDCRDPLTVCDLLQLDVDYAVDLQRRYPHRFIFLRYEDLALNPEQVFKGIWEELGNKYTSRVQRLIRAHNSDGQTKGIYGLQKNSTERVFSWRKTLSYNKMAAIQESCVPVMKNLGYERYSSIEEYVDFSKSPLRESWDSTLKRSSIEQ